MDQFFTWNFLASFAGVGVFTGIITGFLKKYVPIPTQLLAYFIALAGLLLSHAFTSGLTLSVAVLCLFNAVLIATATSGTYDTAKRILNNGKTAPQALVAVAEAALAAVEAPAPANTATAEAPAAPQTAAQPDAAQQQEAPHGNV